MLSVIPNTVKRLSGHSAELRLCPYVFRGKLISWITAFVWSKSEELKVRVTKTLWFFWYFYIWWYTWTVRKRWENKSRCRLRISWCRGPQKRQQPTGSSYLAKIISLCRCMFMIERVNWFCSKEWVTCCIIKQSFKSWMGKFGVKGSFHRVEIRLSSDVYSALKPPFDKSRIVSCIPESLTVLSILPCLTLYALLSTEIGERSPSLNTDTTT